MNREKLTKSEIVDHIYEKEDIKRKDIQCVVDDFLEEIKDALVEDKVIELRGFGTFEIKTRKGRERARNPKTGETVTVRDHGVAIFRPGKELKKMAWELRS